MRKTICAEDRLLITVRFLGTGETYASLHLQFRVGLSTVSVIVKQTRQVIWQVLQPIWMPTLNTDDWPQVAELFQNVANFPHCLGAFHGKHIRIRQPPCSGSIFLNYKNFFSIVLMAIADTNCKFLAIDVGAYGSTSDARVLETSQLGKKIIQQQMNVPQPSPRAGIDQDVPFVFVSDEAFPLSAQLLRPFARRGLDQRTRIFNLRLSRARPYVECQMNTVTSQWRVFHSSIQLNVSSVDAVVKACCVLHNCLREKFHTVSPSSSARHSSNLAYFTRNFTPTLNGMRVCNVFADYFVSSHGSVPWQYSRM